MENCGKQERDGLTCAGARNAHARRAAGLAEIAANGHARVDLSAMSACSACGGDYEDPERGGWVEEESVAEDEPEPGEEERP